MNNTKATDSYYVPAKSCTADEAVFFIIGRIPRPDINLLYPPIPNSEEQHHLGVLDLYADELEGYQTAYDNACDEEQSLDEIASCKQALDKFEIRRNHALAVYCALDEEIQKGEKSCLVIDKELTVPERKPYITLASLDRWSRKKYGKAFLENVEIEGSVKTPKIEKEKKPRTKQTQQEALILKTLSDHGYEHHRLPKGMPGKKGVRREIRDELDRKYPFDKLTAFEAAWERLSKSKEISYDPPLKKQ